MPNGASIEEQLREWVNQLAPEHKQTLLVMLSEDDRVQRAGVASFENLALDTYADEPRFFSYRRTTHRKEPDYGRLVSAIVL